MSCGHLSSAFSSELRNLVLQLDFEILWLLSQEAEQHLREMGSWRAENRSSLPHLVSVSAGLGVGAEASHSSTLGLKSKSIGIVGSLRAVLPRGAGAAVQGGQVSHRLFDVILETQSKEHVWSGGQYSASPMEGH